MTAGLDLYTAFLVFICTFDAQLGPDALQTHQRDNGTSLAVLWVTRTWNGQMSTHWRLAETQKSILLRSDDAAATAGKQSGQTDH